jgi:hypothetical protein
MTDPVTRLVEAVDAGDVDGIRGALALGARRIAMGAAA